MASSLEQVTSGKRWEVIDFLRGWFLIVIFCDHQEGEFISRVLSQPLGFVSAAEGFIFLSGLVAGLVFPAKTATPCARHCSGNGRFIYRHHLATVAAGVVLFVAMPGLASFWTLESASLAPLREAPVLALGSALLLLFQPHLLNILPLYVGFVLVLPAALVLLQRGRGRLLLGISAGLWLGSLLASSAPLSLSGLRNTGVVVVGSTFQPLAWQFLFFLGAWVGYEGFHRRRLHVPTSGWWWPWLGAWAGLLFLLRVLSRFDGRYGEALGLENIAEMMAVLEGGAFQWMISREVLGPLRLLNFLLLAALFARFYVWWRKVWEIAPGRALGEQAAKGVAFLGRHSLPVFSFQVILTFVSGYVLFRFREAMPDSLPLVIAMETFVTALFLILLWVPACVDHRLRKLRHSEGRILQGAFSWRQTRSF